MKTLTKEQIEEVIDKIAHESTKDIIERLVSNIEVYQNECEKPVIKQQSVALGAMNTATQINISILRDTLIELLCD